MVSHRSDSGATDLMRAQARRLRRLRVALNLNQIQAAEMAGITRDAWGRLEREHDPELARMDGLALARFLDAAATRLFQGAALSADYVLSGRMGGLPHDLPRELMRMELAEEAAAPGARTPSDPPAAPGRRKRQRSTAYSVRTPAPLAD